MVRGRQSSPTIQWSTCHSSKSILSTRTADQAAFSHRRNPPDRLQHKDANAKDIQAKVEAAGWPGVKLSTITTIKADALGTLREAAALGLLRTAEEQVPEPTNARPRRSRSRRRSTTSEEATA
jgi:hypothetical protein